MSIAQLKKRTEALQKMPVMANPRSFTYEELHRMMWRRFPSAYVELAHKKGNRDARFFLEQFEREEADKAERALQRNRGSIR